MGIGGRCGECTGAIRVNGDGDRGGRGRARLGSPAVNAWPGWVGVDQGRVGGLFLEGDLEREREGWGWKWEGIGGEDAWCGVARWLGLGG